MRASSVAEKAGFPTASIIAGAFVPQAKAIAKFNGISSLPIAEYPGVIMNHTEEELRDNVENVLVENIIKGLTTQIKNVLKKREPGREAVIFEGTLDEVNDFFAGKQWTDGLPIVPPTVEKVNKFLRFTARDADDVVGVALPENRQATIWNIAVNGVMAGCRPEYMPVLIAVVEAIVKPEFVLQDAGSTPGWEPLIILNGPIIKQLNFNHEVGALRIGRQANTSIGRFLRLYMRNLAGLRNYPDMTDKGSIAAGFNVVLAENEAAVTGLDWKPFSFDRGFEQGENVVTVQSVVSLTMPIYTAGDTALEHMERINAIFGGTCSYWTHTGIRNGHFYPLLILSPGVAEIFAREGWSKDDIRHYLYQNAKVPAKTIERQAWELGYSTFNIAERVKSGYVSEDFHLSDDPERMIPVFIKPESIGIVVSGDPGRNQCKGVVQNHKQGAPVSAKIDLPEGWDELHKG